MKKYTIINCIALMLFLITVTLIFIFKDEIKPIDDKIIYEYEKRIAEYMALPENQNKVSLDYIERRNISDNYNYNLSYEYYVLGEDDEYAVFLEPKSGDIKLYTKKNNKIESLIQKNNEPSMFILHGSEKGSSFLVENMEYFNPFTVEYEKPYFIKEKNDKKVVVSRTCISYKLWFRKDKKIYPILMTEKFHNDIIDQINKIGETDLIENLEGVYRFCDVENINSIMVANREIGESLPFLDIKNRKKNFYYIRNLSTNNYGIATYVFEKLGYNEFDMRRMDEEYGYDEDNLPACIMETTVDFTTSPPAVSYEFIPISPLEVEYKFFEDLPKEAELMELSDAEILELIFKAAENRDYEFIDEIYPSNKLTDPEKNDFYNCFTYFKNLKIEKVYPEEQENVFHINYEAPHFNFLGFSQNCSVDENIPIGNFPPEDYEKNGGTFHYDKFEMFYAMEFDEDKGHWVISGVGASPLK